MQVQIELKGNLRDNLDRTPNDRFTRKRLLAPSNSPLNFLHWK